MKPFPHPPTLLSLLAHDILLQAFHVVPSAKQSHEQKKVKGHKKTSLCSIASADPTLPHTISTRTQEWCAMSLKFPLQDRGRRVTAKLALNWGGKKRKTHSALPREEIITTSHTTLVFECHSISLLLSRISSAATQIPSAYPKGLSEG